MRDAIISNRRLLNRRAEEIRDAQRVELLIFTVKQTQTIYV